MTYCIDFFRKFKKDGNFCGLDKGQVSRLTAYLEIVEMLMKQNIPEEQVYKNFSVRAAGALIAAKGDAHTEGLNYVTAQLKEGKIVQTKDMQSTLQSCTCTTSKPVSVPKQEEKPKIEKSEKPENTAGNYQPGELKTTSLPPQPSLGEKVRAEEMQEAAANQQHVVELPPPPKRAPCLSGQPCPKGGRLLQKPAANSMLGPRCSVNLHEIKQLFLDECPLEAAVRLKGTPAEAFQTADKLNGAKVLRELKPVTISSKVMEILWRPSPKMQAFIERLMKAEGLGTPGEALDLIVGNAMGDE